MSVAQFRIREAIQLIKNIEAQYDPDQKGYVLYSDFKRFIVRNYGSDRSTISKYRDILILFKFIKLDQLDPEIVRITYRDSQEYKDIKHANSWFDDSKTPQ